MLALDQREQKDHDRDLEERGDDAREAGAHRPVGVQVGAREQEDRDQNGQRREVLGLVNAWAGLPLHASQ